MSQPVLNEVALARECLQRLGEKNSVLHRTAHVLELVAHSSVGLGEVLQDFAHQAWGQLRNVIRAAQNNAHAENTPDDMEVLHNIHLILKTAKNVLDQTPVAMLRNKAETIGEKEKLSRADIAQVAHAFMDSPDIARLLASENSGLALVALLTQADIAGTVILPEYASIFLHTTANC